MFRVCIVLYSVKLALGASVAIPLSFVPVPPPGPGFSLEFRKSGPSQWQAQEPGGLPVTLDSAEGGGYWAAIEHGEPQLLEAGGDVTFKVRREGREWPYLLRYQRRTNGGEEFRWLPAYRFAGSISLSGCSASVTLLDGNRAAIEGVPVTFGKPFSLCGAEWLLGKPSADVLSLTPAEFPPLRLGDALDLTDFRDHLQSGKLLLLDFWASWCAPCLDAFPAIDRMLVQNSDRLQVIGVNVDGEERLTQAREIGRRLRWPVFFHGFGEHEPLWRALAKESAGRPLELPFYAVVNANGTLLYAGESSGMLDAMSQALGRPRR